jgi:Tol biopolymer transport system component
MPARGLAVALLLGLVLAACGDDSNNPFAGVGASRPPSAAMALLFLSSSYASEPGQPHELLATDVEGTTVERLTSCATAETPCDFVQVAPSADRNRVAAIRTEVGAEPGATALYFMDLSRSVETILQPRRRVAFVDWAPDNSFLLYMSNDTGGNEDLFFSNPDGSSEQNLTNTTAVRERQARVDPGARTAAFERIDSAGVSRIYIYQETPVTSGDATGPALPDTPYRVGADADPAWSPDAASIVFRRLTGIGNGGLGTWDVMTVKVDGTGLRTIATGAAFRGAPDWGRAGIVFVESDAATALSSLVLVQPDGTGRKVLRTEALEFGMAAPRFLFGE